MTDREKKIMDGILKVIELESCLMPEFFDILATYTIDVAMDLEDSKSSQYMQRIGGRLVECKMLAEKVKDAHSK
jgi:hypothetical protein